MLPHYLAKISSSSFGISGRKWRRECNILWFLNTHPILMHLPYLLTYCFNFRFLSRQVLWTEAAISAHFAWHWPDHHWQCNWRVAWTFSRMYVGKKKGKGAYSSSWNSPQNYEIRWIRRATNVIIFSHMTRQFCFCLM